MAILALDVDGVLLDPDRNGRGPWTNELEIRFGIGVAELREAFFLRSWDDIVTGRRSVEDGLVEALERLGAVVEVEAVLSCWFDADYTPIDDAFDLARTAAEAGHRIALATNQEHRRAAYLHRRIGEALPLEAVFYSADLGYPKHDPRFFEAASQRLGVAGVDLSSVVFVDDVVENVEVASEFGWTAVHAAVDRPWMTEVERLLGFETLQS
jgi:putative hydrolase of the HAD superfamily